MEVTFEEARAHKGRGNPTLLGPMRAIAKHNSHNVEIILFSYDFGAPNTQTDYSWTVRQTIWYSKSLPTFKRCTCLGSSVPMG